MQMTFEEFKKLPKCLDREDWDQIVQYILYIAYNEDYKKAVDYISTNYFRHSDERIQAAAVDSLQILLSSDDDIESIDGNFILPLLFENLKNADNSIGGVKNVTIDLLGTIENLIPKYKLAIYRALFSNHIDFFTEKILKVCTNKADIDTHSNMKEKEELILSFCQHSTRYEDIMNLCLSTIRDSCNETLNIAAFNGLIYLVMRFEKIDFDAILPYIKDFISKDGMEIIYVESLLYNIAVIIPSLRERCLELLDPIAPYYRERMSKRSLEQVLI